MTRGFTPEDDALIVRLYRRMTLTEIAARLGRRATSVRAHYHVLVRRGIVDPYQRFARRRWTAAEDDYLRDNWGVLSDAAIARHLKRSIVACEIRAKRRLQQGRMDAIYTGRMVARLFGVDEHLVIRWIKEGLLKARKSAIRTNTRAMWDIDDQGIDDFIRRFPWRYDRTRIERKTHWRNLADEIWARDPWLSTPEAAAALGVAARTVTTHCVRGWLRAEKRPAAGMHGWAWRIPQSALASFQKRQRYWGKAS